MLLFFSRLNEPLVTASLSGAMVYTLAQSKYTGIRKFIAFAVSFFMGIAGADFTTDILSGYLPDGVQGNSNVGAFICSVLVVTVSVKALSYTEHNLLKKITEKNKGNEI